METERPRSYLQSLFLYFPHISRPLILHKITAKKVSAVFSVMKKFFIFLHPTWDCYILYVRFYVKRMPLMFSVTMKMRKTYLWHCLSQYNNHNLSNYTQHIRSEYVMQINYLIFYDKCWPAQSRPNKSSKFFNYSLMN